MGGRKGRQNPYVSDSIAVEYLGVNKLLIARSQPKNLRDYLVPLKLFQANGGKVSDHIAFLRQDS